MKKILFILLTILFINSTFGQSPTSPLTRILFIFDYSYSMYGKWGKEKKIDVARRILGNLVDSLGRTRNVQLALRLYGHQFPTSPQNCNDTKLEVPFDFNNGPKIKAKLISNQPKGTTPIARSLEQCADDFPPMSNCRNIVILITDGIEACGGDPCAIAIALHKKGIILRPFVIGIGLDVELKKAFECLGDYYDANTEDSFNKILTTVVTKATKVTTAQVNLLDINGKPSETDVNMTFSDASTGNMLFNSIHTLNRWGNPDTMTLDANFTYKIDIHTIPPLVIDNIKLTPGKHNIIAQDAAQGFLIVQEENKGREYAGVKFIVRQKDEMNTLNVQEFFKTEKYLVGKYDLELLTLPRLYVNNVVIKQSEIKTVAIPQPGTITFTMPTEGVGSIYQVQKGKVRWVINLNNTMREVLLLQPGKYIAVYRPKNAKSMSFSVTKDFEVESGRSMYVKF